MITLLLVALALAEPVGWPNRPANAPSGTAVARELTGDHRQRQSVLEAQLLAGNVPAHLRDWTPVTWMGRDTEGSVHRVRVWITRDYLAVGNAKDFFRAALDWPTAVDVATRLDAWLPTPAVVDHIWAAADRKFTPAPLPPGPDMCLPSYALQHRSMVGRSVPPGVCAGHKKDVVLTVELRNRPGQLPIYGWQHPDGTAIQPLSLWHGAYYADYSHGIRLVRRAVQVDGRSMDSFDVLADARLWPLLSDEGAIEDASELLCTP